MKTILLLVSIFIVSHAFDESQQLQIKYPLQNEKNTQKLLHAMQENIQTYLYETPRSSYAYFDKKSSTLKSQALITWIHGELYVNTLGSTEKPHVRVTLNNEQFAHLGDYRYDIFTLLSDLLLKMQEDSDFSGSKEKAILGTLVDGYFARLEDQKLQCPCIDEALSSTKQSDILVEYTKLQGEARRFNTRMETLKRVDSKHSKLMQEKMNAYLKDFDLLPVKDIAMDEYGDYLFLCEGKTKAVEDDIIFVLSARTLPVTYQVNAKMKKAYLNTTLLKQEKVISSFNKNQYVGHITIDGQNFYVNKLNPSLKLQPQSEKTRAYKNYASALGFTLASFHSNANIKPCKDFKLKAISQVKQRLLKTELIAMVYAYNETLEERWEIFNNTELITRK